MTVRSTPRCWARASWLLTVPEPRRQGSDTPGGPAGKVGDRGVRGRGVRPQDHAQAPSEVACQRADAAGCVPNFVTATMGFIHRPIISG